VRYGLADAGGVGEHDLKAVDSQRQLNEARANRLDQDKTPTNEFSGWYAAFKQQKGRTPNAQEIQQYEVSKARAGKDTSAADTQKAIQVSEYKQRQLEAIDRQKEMERTKRYAEPERDLSDSFFFGRNRLAKLTEGKQNIDTQLETKYAPKVQQMSDEADKMLGLTKSGATLKAGSTPSTPASTQRTQPKVGDTILVAGKLRKVVGWNPTTKKPIVAHEGR
jgi:hypothetical protein